jgi:hypothetical protein
MTAPQATTQAIKIIDTADVLRIAVPVLKSPLRIILFTVLALFWSLIFVVNGPQTGLIAVFALTTYPALLIGLNSSRVSLENGQLKTSFGPVPMPAPRHTLMPPM